MNADLTPMYAMTLRSKRMGTSALNAGAFLSDPCHLSLCHMKPSFVTYFQLHWNTPQCPHGRTCMFCGWRCVFVNLGSGGGQSYPYSDPSGSDRALSATYPLDFITIKGLLYYAQSIIYFGGTYLHIRVTHPLNYPPSQRESP